MLHPAVKGDMLQMTAFSQRIASLLDKQAQGLHCLCSGPHKTVGVPGDKPGWSGCIGATQHSPLTITDLSQHLEFNSSLCTTDAGT